MKDTERAKAEALGREIYDVLEQQEVHFPVAALALAQAVLLIAKAASGKQPYFRYLELWEHTAQQWWYGEAQ